MKKKTIWIIVILFVVIIAYVISSKNNNQYQYRIGVLLPLTGNASVSGEKLLQGVTLAKKEADPNKFIFFIEDTHTKTSDAVTAARKLLDVDKVDVIIGAYVPEEVTAIAPIAKEKGVTIFSASYCSDAFKELTNVFCGYPGALDQLRTVIPEVKKLGIKTMALVNTNDDFGIASRDGMVSLANDGGYTIALNELVPFGSRDLKAAADKVVASKADGVFMASGDTSQAFTLMKILDQHGYKGMRVTFVDIDKKALRDFGSSTEGTYAPGIAPNKFSDDFTKRYTDNFGKSPDDYVSPLGYDIAKEVLGVMSLGSFAKDNFVTEALLYKYQNPAIKDFSYNPDRSIHFKLELWQAKSGDYMSVQ